MQALLKDFLDKLRNPAGQNTGQGSDTAQQAESSPQEGQPQKPKPVGPQFGMGAKITILLFLAGIILVAIRPKSPPPSPEVTRREPAMFETGARGFGAFATEEERYTYLVQKTEGDYTDLRRRFAEQEELNKTLLRTLEEIKESNKALSERVGKAESDIARSVERALSQLEERIKMALSAPTEDSPWQLPAPGRLRLISVPPSVEEIDTEPDKRKYVYLPAGSFVRATLLTGAYAPVDRGNPLPVLLSIDEGFHGPSMSRIPLKGTLAIGKAIADVNSERAIIQIADLSFVGPQGQVFETSGGLGWVAAQDGTLGIPGKLVRRTGKVVTGAFASGFLSGAAEALSYAETEPERHGRRVTGDLGKFAGYAGLSSAAATMSRHYADLLDQIVSAVKINMGESCYVIMSKGVEIEGLLPEEMPQASHFTGAGWLAE